MFTLLKTYLGSRKKELALIVLSLALLLSYRQGYKQAKLKSEIKIASIKAEYEQAQASLVQQAIDDHVALQSNLSETASEYQVNQVNAEQKIRVIEREVIKYVEKNPNLSDCRLPDDGVQLVNAMVRAANSGRSIKAATTNTD